MGKKRKRTAAEKAADEAAERASQAEKVRVYVEAWKNRAEAVGGVGWKFQTVRQRYLLKHLFDRCASKCAPMRAPRLGRPQPSFPTRSRMLYTLVNEHCMPRIWQMPPPVRHCASA